MSTFPNPPADPRPDGSSADADNKGRRRLLTVAGVVVASAVASAVAIGGPSFAGATETERVPIQRGAQVVDSELGDTTLDELADELADLGLALRIEPADAEPGDSGFDDELVDETDDPFANMTEAEIDALSDEEFFDLLDSAGINSGEAEVLGAFDITGDSIDVSGASSAEVAMQAEAIWNRFAKLIPADQRTMVTSFELAPAADEGAYVYPSESDPTKWVLGVSTGLGDDLDYVLIHEFGHLLTLQAKKVPPAADADPETCPTYFTGEGCALSGTMVAEFVQKFWPEAQIDEVNRLQDDEDYDGLEAFYGRHSDDFVTDYATTNPGEDIAETFTHFVTEERPSGNTIADQKVNLFWNDQAMVALRTAILANQQG